MTIMASILRSLFGGHSSRSSSKERTQSHSKSHSRSRSVPPAVNTVPYAYTASSGSHAAHGPVPSVPSTSTRSHSPTSSRMTRPSPLRYNTYDSSAISSKTRPTKPLQLPSGTISYKSGDAFVPYPIYTPALSTYSSSRTNSNSSIYPPSSVSGHGHGHSSSYSGRPPSAPRTSSSGSVTSRPALKQTHTWHGGIKSETGPRPHVSFVNPKRPITLHMHPLFAASHHSRAPISYNVTHAPTSQTIVDRTTRTAVPSHTLSQPATDPPTLSKLVLRSDKLPWPIVIPARCSAVPPQPKSAAKFYLGGSSPTTASADAVTNMDVLHALHHTLTHRVTKEEWDALGQGSRAQRKVSRAYERRCKAAGGGWEGGIRRIDWLGEKTRLIGVEVDKGASETGVGKLIFGRP